MSQDSSLLEKTLKLLFEQAFKDGVVTDDEFEIIEQVELDIELYMDSLNRALLDNLITTEESDELEALKDKILEKATQIAQGDGVIDAEEQGLLKKLSEILSEYFITD